jgi:hypothetical protein
MDAQTVARVAGIKIGTLNSWVQRNLLRGMTIGASGRRRDIDFETALRILIIAELVRLGISPTMGMFFAEAGFHRRMLFIRVPAIVVVTEKGPETWPARELCFGFSSEEEIPEVFKREFPAGLPAAAYSVVNVEVLEARLQRAWEEWEQSRGEKT